MTSTITLYYGSVLNRDRNIALDEQDVGIAVERYLQTLTRRTIQGFQYIRHGMDVTIRLDQDQSALAMGPGADDLNYCKIRNGNGNPVYYFVVGKTWKAEKTISLNLRMDTVNTFDYGTDYMISPKTLIRRQHMDRLAPLGNKKIGPIAYDRHDPQVSLWYTDSFFQSGAVESVDLSESYGIWHNALDENFEITSVTFPATDKNGVKGISIECHQSSSGTPYIVFKLTLGARRIIHKPSEDVISPKRKVKTRDMVEFENAPSWSLLYRNREIPDDQNQYENPVDCLLVPDVPTQVRVPSADGEITTAMIPSGNYMLLFQKYGPATIVFEGVQYSPVEQEWNASGIIKTYPLAIYNDGGTLKLLQGYAGNDTEWGGVVGQWVLIGTATGPITAPGFESLNVRIVSTLPDATATLNMRLTWTSVVSLTGYYTYMLNDLSSIDRTDPRNIKLIKCPYCPCQAKVSSFGGVITLEPTWIYDGVSGFMKLMDPTKPFVDSVEPTTDMSFLTQMAVSYPSDGASHERDDAYESKLLHSDYFAPKFVYDSFGKEFHLERIDSDALFSENPKRALMAFTFVMSRNVVSKFLFDFPQYSGYVEETQDFDHILCVARNNEEVLYNSQYLNYLRTGYNYDLKTKERTDLAAGVGIGLNVAALVAGIGIGAATGNPIAIGGAVTAGIGLVGQLVSYARTTAQNEQNIAQKLQEAQMQAVSVQNADDCDLLEYYSKNKAQFSYYAVSDEMLKAMADLFHYCGYKVNLQGVPDRYTRYRFNFIQADLEIIDSANLTVDVEEDIKARFSEGITFIHWRDGFDLNQEMENWESSIVPYLPTPSPNQED